MKLKDCLEDYELEEGFIDGLKKTKKSAVDVAGRIGRANINAVKKFFKKRADIVASDRERIKSAEQEVENLKQTKKEASKIGGKKWLEARESIKDAKKDLKEVEKSTYLAKLRRKIKAIVLLLALLGMCAKPFINPNLLMSEMNQNTIEKRMNNLEGAIAEYEMNTNNFINNTQYLYDKYDEFQDEYKKIKFENGKPATAEDAKLLNDLAYKVSETASKSLGEMDKKAGSNIVKTIIRKGINMITNVKEFFKSAQVTVGWGDRFNPRGK